MHETDRSADDARPTIPSGSNEQCPHLGLLNDPDTRALYARTDHRCFLPDTSLPAPDGHWQARYCLSGRHDQCPVFRRATGQQRPPELPARRRSWLAALVVAFLVVTAGMMFIAENTRGGAGNFGAGDQDPASSLAIRPTGAATPHPSPTTPIDVEAATPSPVATASFTYTVTVTAVPTATAAAPSPTPTAEAAGTPAPRAPTSTPGPRATGPGTTITHVVAPGETLLEIASRYGVSVQRIIDLNHIQDRDLIYAGEVLRIPAP